LCKKVLFLTGLIKLKTLAKLENTICLLCLPTPDEPDVSVADNCTVVGYGRHTDGSGNSLNADEGNRLFSPRANPTISEFTTTTPAL
jgi:hypothetical protein